MMKQIFGELYAGNVADYDCFVQVVFKDVQDFINVKDDPYYKQVVMPDHANFADTKRTSMVTGWMETHIADGRAAAMDERVGNVDGNRNEIAMNGH
jgi:EthD domain